jgi:hypothetical protein
MKRTALMLCLLAAGCRTPVSDLAPATGPSPEPQIAKLLESISEERLRAMLERLVSFETRNTSSNPDPNGGGIGAARQWILDEMRGFSPRLQVSFDIYQVDAQNYGNLSPADWRISKPVELRNVMAVLPGRSPRRIYVTAHYDSIAAIVNPPPEAGPPGGTGIHWNMPDVVAPGANDDGSGTVLTMELARVFAQSGIEFDATLVFMAVAGEEQGLIGAYLHAQKAQAEKADITAVFNNDIVGNITGGSGMVDDATVRVFSDGPEDSPSRQLARHVAKVAPLYVPGHRVLLQARYDRVARGGDHIAFNDSGFTAIRLSEAAENFSRQHTVADTIDGVSFPYLAKNARVNAAGVASLALAPPAPAVATATGAPLMIIRPAGYDARLRWQASPGATGYRVYWRPTWATDWEETRDVGNVTEHTLPGMIVDNYVFGVSAIGANGQESLVAAYVNPPRGRTTIKTFGGP